MFRITMSMRRTWRDMSTSAKAFVALVGSFWRVVNVDVKDFSCSFFTFRRGNFFHGIAGLQLWILLVVSFLPAAFLVYEMNRIKLYHQLFYQLGDQLYAQLRYQLCDQLYNQLCDQLYNQLYDQLYNQLCDQLHDQLCDQLRIQLQEALK